MRTVWPRAPDRSAESSDVGRCVLDSPRPTARAASPPHGRAPTRQRARAELNPPYHRPRFPIRLTETTGRARLAQAAASPRYRRAAARPTSAASERRRGGGVAMSICALAPHALWLAARAPSGTDECVAVCFPTGSPRSSLGCTTRVGSASRPEMVLDSTREFHRLLILRESGVVQDLMRKGGNDICAHPPFKIYPKTTADSIRGGEWEFSRHGHRGGGLPRETLVWRLSTSAAGDVLNQDE